MRYELAHQKPFVCAIRLSRNFGQHYAITAGLDHAYSTFVYRPDTSE